MLLIVYKSESRFAIEINCVNQITFIMKIDNSLTKFWINLRPILKWMLKNWISNNHNSVDCNMVVWYNFPNDYSSLIQTISLIEMVIQFNINMNIQLKLYIIITDLLPVDDWDYRWQRHSFWFWRINF